MNLVDYIADIITEDPNVFQEGQLPGDRGGSSGLDWLLQNSQPQSDNKEGKYIVFGDALRKYFDGDYYMLNKAVKEKQLRFVVINPKNGTSVYNVEDLERIKGMRPPSRKEMIRKQYPQ